MSFKVCLGFRSLFNSMASGLFTVFAASFCFLCLPVFAHDIKTERPPALSAMAEMLMVSPSVPDWERSNEWIKFEEDLRVGRDELSVQSIGVDFWWPLGPAYYRHLIKVMRSVNKGQPKPLTIDAVLSKHPTGKDVGDTVHLDPPASHLARLRANSEHPDLRYKGEDGTVHDGMASVWGFGYIMSDYRARLIQFRKDFDADADLFSKLTEGHWTGEWKYKSYEANGKGHFRFPERGLYQMSSDLAQASLRRNLKAHGYSLKQLNKELTDLGLETFEEYESDGDWEKNRNIQILATTDQVDQFFKVYAEYSLLGQAITTWYNQSLIDGILESLREAARVLHAPDSPFRNVPIAIKIPGTHWFFHRRLLELTSGLISTAGANPDPTLPYQKRQPSNWSADEGLGYRPFFEKVFGTLRREFPASKFEAIFTCGEMPDCKPTCLQHGHGVQCETCPFFDSTVPGNKGKRAFSKARTLARTVVKELKRLGVATTIENAMVEGLLKPDHMANLLELAEDSDVSLLRLRAFRHSPLARGFADSLKRIKRKPIPAAPCPSKIKTLAEPMPTLLPAFSTGS